MPTPLSRKDAKQITGVLNAAAEIVQAAHIAYATGHLGDDMVASVASVRDDMGRFLAFFEDGNGYGWAQPSALEQMRAIEQMSSDLVAHINSATIEHVGASR